MNAEELKATAAALRRLDAAKRPAKGPGGATVDAPMQIVAALSEVGAIAAAAELLTTLAAMLEKGPEPVAYRHRIRYDHPGEASYWGAWILTSFPLSARDDLQVEPLYDSAALLAAYLDGNHDGLAGSIRQDAERRWRGSIKDAELCGADRMKERCARVCDEISDDYAHHAAAAIRALGTAGE